MQIEYPVKYSKSEGAVVDSIGRVVTLVFWPGRQRTLSVGLIHEIGEKIASCLNSSVGLIINNPSVAVEETKPEPKKRGNPNWRRKDSNDAA
jgi:hypothetical protein